MKLFTRYNRITVASTVVIFLLASIAFSFLLRYVIISGVDEDLRIEKNEILSYISKYNTLPPVVEVHDQYTTFQPVKALPQLHRSIYTHHAHDAHDGDEETLRSILFGVTANGSNYIASVSKSLEGTDNLIQSIIIITIVTILLILTTTYFINRFVLRKLWQPFYQTLALLGNFKLSDTGSVEFAASDISEFGLLNTTLSGVINKAKQDYTVLKEFTENASHEMQTPLAVINSKLDVIIQSESLTAQQSAAAESAYDAIRKLKRLNQSLLLLAKIENGQFAGTEEIELSKVIQNKLAQFAGQWQQFNLVINTDLLPVKINSNPQLIDVLLNNLLSNAVRHNTGKGFINITLKEKELTIGNTGNAVALNEQYIFSRFYKGNVSTEGHGLGLSIVRQICDSMGCTCHYQFNQPNIHSFTIGWS